MAAQVEVLMKKLADKDQEIQKFHLEKSIVLDQIRTLLGQPEDVFNKARHFDNDIQKGRPDLGNQGNSYPHEVF